MVVFVLFYFVVVVCAYLFFSFLFLDWLIPKKDSLTEARPLDSYPKCWMNALILSLRRKPGFGFCAPLALCWGGWRSVTSESMLSKSSPLFSGAANLEHLPISTQTQARQKPVPQAAPQDIRTLDYSPVLSFPSQGQARSWGLPPVVWCCHGGDITGRRCHVLSYWLWCSWPHALLGCRSPSPSLWIFHKGNWLIHVLLNQCVHVGKEVRGFPFHHFVDVAANLLWV